MIVNVNVKPLAEIETRVILVTQSWQEKERSD